MVWLIYGKVIVSMICLIPQTLKHVFEPNQTYGSLSSNLLPMGLIDLAQFIPSLMSWKTSTPRQETFGRSISGACALASSLGPLTGLDFEAVDAFFAARRSRSEYVSHTHMYEHDAHANNSCMWLYTVYVYHLYIAPKSRPWQQIYRIQGWYRQNPAWLARILEDINMQ